MKKINKFFYLTFIMLFASVSLAATTVTLTPTADTDIREIVPDYAKSDRNVMLIKSSPGDSAKGYIKYTLPLDTGTITSAEFKITRSSAGPWNYTYDVFGMKDAAIGNDWPELSPGDIPGQPYTSGLTWNNAPANDQGSMGGFDSNDVTASLGTFTFIGTNNGGSAGGTETMSSQDLVDFLNADSDRTVTLMIGRQGTSTSADLFATKEHTTLDAPSLVITYEPLNVVTVTLDAVMDTDIREIVPDYAKGNRDVMLLKSASGDSAKGYVKYLLPNDIVTMLGAEFRIARTSAGPWNFTYDIFGMNDDANGNDWNELSPGDNPGQPYTTGMTWNNAPANDRGSMGGFDSNDTTASLGTFTTIGTNNGGSAPDNYSMVSAALVEFINTDTDGYATLLIGRQGTSTSADLFATKENATHNPPQLVLTYVALPTKTVVIDVYADTDIRQAAPDYAKSNRAEMLAKNNTNDSIKAYMKFKLPDDVEAILDANFTVTRVVLGPWAFEYNLYGMNDDANGNDWPELSPGQIPGQPYTDGLTWNNAPVNDKGSPYGFDSNDTTGLLGSFQVKKPGEGGFVGDKYHIITPDLVDFLNTDTDGIVTLLMGRVGFSNSADQFATKERTDGNEPAQLILTYVPKCGVRLLSDLNWDCVTNIDDIDEMATDWLVDDINFIQNPNSDIDIDDDVDLADFAWLANGWLSCSDPCNSACDEYWQPSELAVQRWNTWRKSWNTFPIAAWSYFSRYTGSVAEYQTYEAAGLTMVQAPTDQFDNAVAAGLRPLIGSWENLHYDDLKLEQFVQFPTATNTDVLGYMLEDEPKDPAEFALLGDASAYIYYYDLRDAIPICNLLPIYGSWTDYYSTYNDYVNSYVNTVAPTVLQCTNYSILDDGTDRAGFYENMELLRQKALNAGIGFAGFALVNGHHNYREPSESDLNWQVWSYIAYGAKGIWYYNYRIEPTGGFGEGLVTHADGTPTATYPLAQAINDDLKAMGHVLMTLKSTGVYHTGSSVPTGTSQYVNGYLSFLSDFTSDDFILGEFENQDDATDTTDYLMIMNKRHSATTTSAAEAADATFTPNPDTLNVYQFNVTTQTWQLLTGGTPYTINSIGGGQAVLLKFTN